MDERPTTKDLLERDEFIKRLGKALVAPDNSRATGVVVGITGEWGSGKSSILKMAAKYLEGPPHGAIVIQFDPWIISGRDDLITRLLVQIGKRLGQYEDAWAKNLAKSFLDYAGGLAPIIGEATGFGIVGKLVGGVFAPLRKSLDKAPDIHQQRENLKKALEKAQVAIIVMIDEIDRLDDGEIRSVTQFVRAVADFDRISYLLAYDQKRVAEALGGGATDEYQARGSAYLEKIVQYQIPLPVLAKEQLRRLTEDALNEFMPSGWNQGRRWEGMAEVLFPDVLQNLRDIKRFAGHARVLMDLANEVDRLDLLGWAALTIKAPQTIKTISENPYLVSSLRLSALHGIHSPDQLDVINVQEMTQAERLIAISPNGERTPAIMYLIGILFQKAGIWSVRDSHLPDRIEKPRPLLTVLSQGIPYGHFSKDEVSRFLQLDRPGRGEELLKLLMSDRLDLFLERFAPVFSQLERNQQVGFWLDVAAFLEGGAQDWPCAWDRWRNLAGEFFGWIATRSVASEFPAVAKGLRGACLTLDGQGEWQLLPELLYSQVWAHGLFGRNASDRYPQFLQAEEAEGLCRQLGRRFVTQYLKNFFALGRLRAPDALIIAAWSGEWTQEGRDSLTHDLGDSRVLDALVLLFFGNNSVSGRKTLSKLFDVEVFALSAEIRLKEHGDGMNPSLAETYRRIVDNGIRDD
jgi:hypothetical protein